MSHEYVGDANPSRTLKWALILGDGVLAQEATSHERSQILSFWSNSILQRLKSRHGEYLSRPLVMVFSRKPFHLTRNWALKDPLLDRPPSDDLVIV